jgi:hypothetical protein
VSENLKLISAIVNLLRFDDICERQSCAVTVNALSEYSRFSEPNLFITLVTYGI